MAKIFSGITLVIALVATFFGFQSKDLVGKLQVAAEREHTDRLATLDKLKKTEVKLKTAEDELKTTKEDLSKTQLELTATKTDLEAKKTALADATEKMNTAETQLATLKKSYDDLKAQFPGTPEEIAKQIADMKAKIPELEAKVTAAEKDVAELKEVNKTLTTQKKDFDEKLASQRKVIDRYKTGIMQKGIRGHVLAVNAGWGFCVLSIGDRQGAAANKIMVVARGGQAIGKVKISNVEASQSVADIIPSSFTRGTYVEPGDDVIFTGEDKVREEPAAAAGNAPAASPLPGALPLPPP